MKKVTNVSGKRREIAHPDYVHPGVDPDETVEVPDHVAESLAEQPKNWQAVDFDAGPDGSVEQILADVRSGKVGAAEALTFEQAGKNRKTLIRALEEIIEAHEGEEAV